MSSTYISGHHESVLRSHRWRTAKNSAAYLLEPLDTLLQKLKTNRPSEPPTLLDIGCGPGTITLDFARILAPYGGHVTGIDPSASVISQAQQTATEQGITNVTFATDDALKLSFPDNSFDVVHTHQVLQHVGDPIGVLREKRRVCKAGGLVASREADFSGFAWWPLDPAMDEWMAMWKRIARDDGNEPDTGRRLLSLCLAAGFKRSEIVSTASNWCYSTPEEVAWWGNLWVERVYKSDFAKKLVQKGFGTKDDLDRYAAAYQKWAASEDAWYVLLNGEAVCQM